MKTAAPMTRPIRISRIRQLPRNRKIKKAIMRATAMITMVVIGMVIL